MIFESSVVGAGPGLEKLRATGHGDDWLGQFHFPVEDAWRAEIVCGVGGFIPGDDLTGVARHAAEDPDHRGVGELFAHIEGFSCAK